MGEMERERDERQGIEQEALLDQDSLNEEEIGRPETLKRRMQIDLKAAVDDSPHRDGLPASSSDHGNSQVRGGGIVLSAAVDQREEVQPRDHAQETGEKMTTSALIRTPSQYQKKVDSVDTSLNTTQVRITFRVREGDIWKHDSFLDVDPFDPSNVARKAINYMRQKMRLYDTGLSLLPPEACFQTVLPAPQPPSSVPSSSISRLD